MKGLFLAVVFIIAISVSVLDFTPNILDMVDNKTVATTESSEEVISPKNEIADEWVTVERVVDGDTFVLSTGERVRMILINTPESVHPDESKNTEFGKLASEFTKELLEGEKVKLEKDVSDTDKYGRLLRYVYLEDGTFVNEYLVKEGYAQIATYPPDVKYKDLILEAEKHARENEKGLWGE